MNIKYNKDIFIIASIESYEFLSEHLNNITYSYDLENCNIIMPFEYSSHDFIKLNIDQNSHNFLIESDEYVRNLDNYNSLSNSQIQDLRILESKKRAYKYWLDKKLNYSKQQIPKSGTCIVINNYNNNHIIQKELRDEMNIAKQLNKAIINIDQDKFISLNEKIKILKQMRNK